MPGSSNQDGLASEEFQFDADVIASLCTDVANDDPHQHDRQDDQQPGPSLPVRAPQQLDLGPVSLADVVVDENETRAINAAYQALLHRGAQLRDGRPGCLAISRGKAGDLEVFAALALRRHAPFDQHLHTPGSLFVRGFQRTLQLVAASPTHMSGLLVFHIAEVLPSGIGPQHPNLSQMWLSLDRDRSTARLHNLEVPLVAGTASTLVYLHAEHNKDPGHWNIRHRFVLSVTLMTEGEQAGVVAAAEVDTYVYAKPRTWTHQITPMDDPLGMP